MEGVGMSFVTTTSPAHSELLQLWLERLQKKTSMQHSSGFCKACAEESQLFFSKGGQQLPVNMDSIPSHFMKMQFGDLIEINVYF